MKAQLLIILLVLVAAGAAAVYFSGDFSFSIAQTSSGCQILSPVWGQYQCKLQDAISDQWSIPGGSGGWLECNGNRWQCDFTLTPQISADVYQNGYYIYYDLHSASDISIDKGILKAPGLTDYSFNGVTSHLTTKTFSLSHGQRMWLQQFYTNYAGVTGIPYAVSGTSRLIILCQSRDYATCLPLNWQVDYVTDGCQIRKADNSGTLPKDSSLILAPGGTVYPYIQNWQTIPYAFNTVTYQGQQVYCGITQTNLAQKALYSLKTVQTTDGAGNNACYAYPETTIKSVDCCNANDAPSGYYCDTNTFTLVATQPPNQQCQSDYGCPGNGVVDCKSTLAGNQLIMSGGCDLTTHTCVVNAFVKNVDCCPSPNTCQTGYICSVAQNYQCVLSTNPPTTCPYACCDGSGGYQVKVCSGGYTCCQGTCPTADKPVCCGNGVTAKSQSDCGGTPPVSGCAKEGQTPNEIDGCCEGYKITQVGGVAGIGARIVCTASGTYFEELLKYLPWILLAIIFIVVIFLLLSKKKRR